MFVLQWEDLFSEDGLDTWQVRTSNVLTILAELIRSTEIAEAFPPHAKALPEMIREALSCLGRDVILHERHPFVGDVLAGLEKTAGSSAEANPRWLAAVRRSATVLKGRLKSYRDELIEEVGAVLKSSDAQPKERLMRLAMCLGTELASGGYSLRHLNAVGDLLLDRSIPFEKRFARLVDHCGGKDVDYEVYFIVQRWPYQVGDTQGVQFFRKAQVNLNGPVAAAFVGKASDHELVARIKVSAKDPFAARRLAESLLSAAFGAIAFAALSVPALKFEQALVVLPDHQSFEVEADSSRRGYLRRSKDWEALARILLSLPATLPDETQRQLTATLQYYRLAAENTSDEVRLVNLWVALENLIRAGHASTVERLVEFLPPALAARNIRHVLRGFVSKLKRSLQFQQLRALGLLDPGKRHVPPERLLRVLRTPQVEKLMAALDGDPLLRYRLTRFVTGTLKDGRAAASYLVVNKQNISWQLQRIYRARNLVVHEGEPHPALRHLLQHLHNYLWSAIRLVTMDLAQGGGQWGIIDALEHRKLLYEHSIRCLEGAGHDLPIDALTSPDQFLQHRAMQPAKPDSFTSPQRRAKLDSARPSEPSESMDGDQLALAIDSPAKSAPISKSIQSPQGT